MIVVFGVLILLLLVQLVRSGNPPKALRVPASRRTPVVDRLVKAPLELDDAIRSAEGGDYDRAVHLLLEWVLAEIGRAAVPVLPHETARRILRKPSLKTNWREALAPLIGIVERCHFEGGSAQQEEFENCLSALTDLRSELRRQA